MNDKPKSKLIPKQQLEIVKYEADIPYGQAGKTLDRMNAKNHSLPEDDPLFDKPVRYTVFNGDLKTFLRGQGEGAFVICDIEERDRPESQYGPDRTIVQVYQDGQPVSQKKGGGQYRRSLEDDLILEGVKRRSIEGQTAVAQVGEILRADIANRRLSDEPPEWSGCSNEDWKRIVAKYWKAVEKGLDNYLTDPPAPKVERPAQETASKTRQKPPAANSGGDKAKDDKKDMLAEEEPIKHVGDLLTRASKFDPPVTRADFLEALSINDPAEITDLEDAWKKAKDISAARRKSPAGSDQGKKAASEETEKAWEKLSR